MKTNRWAFWQMGVMAGSLWLLGGLSVSGVSAEVVSGGLSGGDRRAPRLVAVAPPDEMTPSTATLFWVTNEASSTRVEYGPTSEYGFYSAPNPTRVTHHGVVLVHLRPATRYHYRLISADAEGNTVYSSDRTFTTPSHGETVKVDPVSRPLL